MRELTKNDLVMLDNVIRLLKHVSFRVEGIDEALGTGQTWTWVNKFRQDLASSIQSKEQQKGLQEAVMGAKEVTPVLAPKTEKKVKPGLRPEGQ